MLCQRIRVHLLENGIKFSSVAKKINVSQNVFSTMLNGKRKITAEEYFAICKTLNIPLDYLLS